MATATGPEYNTSRLDKLRSMIADFQSRFSFLKSNIIKSLQMRNIPVEDAIDKLDVLIDSDEKMSVYKLLLTNETLRKCEDYKALFEKIRFNWNHDSPRLLVRLSRKLNCSRNVIKKLQKYKEDLHHFRVNTLLTMFCKIEREVVQFSEEYCLVAATFESIIFYNMTLESLDNFIVKYTTNYNPCSFPMMLSEIKEDSFIVFFLVPKSVSEVLSDRAKVPELLLRRSGVIQLDIADRCVYNPSISVARSTNVQSSVPSRHDITPMNTKVRNSVPTRRIIVSIKPSSAAPYSMQKRQEQGQPLKATAHELKKEIEQDQPLYYIPELDLEEKMGYAFYSTVEHVRPAKKNKQRKRPLGRELARKEQDWDDDIIWHTMSS